MLIFFSWNVMGFVYCEPGCDNSVGMPEPSTQPSELHTRGALFSLHLPEDFYVHLRRKGLFPDAPDGTPAPTFAARFMALWGLLLAAIGTVTFSICEIINYRFQPSAHTFKRWAARWARFIMRPLGIRPALLMQTPLDPDTPYVFISNHQCALDILALADALPFPFGFVAKAELAEVPFLGHAIRYSASLFIDQRHPRRAVESLKLAGQRIREGNSVLIFPEGHRTYLPCMQPFKRGAFMLALEAGVPLVPIVLIDSYRYVDERKKAVRPGTVHMVVGNPISMEGRTRKDIPRLMEWVRTEMQQVLDEAHRHFEICSRVDELVDPRYRNPAGRIL